jgi:hypothetical protein
VAQAVRERESVYRANGLTPPPVSARRSEMFRAHRLDDRRSVTAVERPCDSASAYIDVIDRVLDKGVVIEAWMRMRIGGIDLIAIDARVIVASIETYLGYWPAFNGAKTLAKRRISGDG